MHLTVLAVEDCPNAPVLAERLAAVLAGREGISVSREVISDEGAAARWGMHGSPTLLIDGADPFAEPGQLRRGWMRSGGLARAASLPPKAASERCIRPCCARS
jgi:hypothetical protein